MEGLKLPDLDFEGHVLFEHFSFNFTNIVLETISVDTSSDLISFDASSQTILIDLKNQNLTFSLDYDIDATLFGRNTGSATLGLVNSNITVAVEVGSTANNTASLVITTLDIVLGDSGLHIVTDNWLTKIIQWFLEITPIAEFNKIVVDKLITLLRPLFNSILNKTLSNLSYNIALEIDKLIDLGFDFHVYENQILSDDKDTYLQLALNATFYDGANPGKKPDVPAPVVMPGFMTEDTIRL